MSATIDGKDLSTYLEGKSSKQIESDMEIVKSLQKKIDSNEISKENAMKILNNLGIEVKDKDNLDEFLDSLESIFYKTLTVLAAAGAIYVTKIILQEVFDEDDPAVNDLINSLSGLFDI